MRKNFQTEEDSIFTVNSIYSQKKDEWNLTLVAGERGLSNRIKTDEVNRPGLLLSGFEKYFVAERVQVIGNAEWAYLNSLSEAKRKESLSRLFSYNIPALFMARGLEVFKEIIIMGDEKQIPVIVSSLPTQELIKNLADFLAYKLAPTTYLHGTLVDVYGVGVLIIGKSGIGKSECALDLVRKGHILIADDLIKIIEYPKGKLRGMSGGEREELKYYIEIRGVGLLDVFALFGSRAVEEEKEIGVVVELIPWEEADRIERTGLILNKMRILNVDVNKLVLPLVPGKHISTIIETIVMDYKLRERGYSCADIIEKLIVDKNEDKETSA